MRIDPWFLLLKVLFFIWLTQVKLSLKLIHLSLIPPKVLADCNGKFSIFGKPLRFSIYIFLTDQCRDLRFFMSVSIMHLYKLLEVFFGTIDIFFFQKLVHVFDLLQLQDCLLLKSHFLNCFNELSEFIWGFIQAVLSQYFPKNWIRLLFLISNLWLNCVMSKLKWAELFFNLYHVFKCVHANIIFSFHFCHIFYLAHLLPYLLASVARRHWRRIECQESFLITTCRKPPQTIMRFTRACTKILARRGWFDL